MQKFLLCAMCFLFCFALCSCSVNDEGEIKSDKGKSETALTLTVDEYEAISEGNELSEPSELSELSEGSSMSNPDDSNQQNVAETAPVQPGEQTQIKTVEPSSSKDSEENNSNPATSDKPTTTQNMGVTVSQEFIIEEGSNNDSESIKNIVIKDTAELRSFFDSLNYHSHTNDGLPEYNICFDDGTTFYVNLSSKWVWRGTEKEANLTEELLSELLVLLGVG